MLVSNIDDESKINIIDVIEPDTPANCEHSHTKFVTKDDKSSIDLTISSFPFYDDDKLKYLQYYIGAKDITCKMSSGERITTELGINQS